MAGAVDSSTEGASCREALGLCPALATQGILKPFVLHLVSWGGQRMAIYIGWAFPPVRHFARGLE